MKKKKAKSVKPKFDVYGIPEQGGYYQLATNVTTPIDVRDYIDDFYLSVKIVKAGDDPRQR